MTREEWVAAALKGTRGDMVFSILADWQEEQDELNEKLRQVALIAYRKGGGRREGDLRAIRQLVENWREK